jgi:hypothetical protein
MATESIITANPNAIPKTAIETIGCEIPFLTDLSEKMRLAIKSSVFNTKFLSVFTNVHNVFYENNIPS